MTDKELDGIYRQWQTYFIPRLSTYPADKELYVKGILRDIIIPIISKAEREKVLSVVTDYFTYNWGDFQEKYPGVEKSKVPFGDEIWQALKLSDTKA